MDPTHFSVSSISGARNISHFTPTREISVSSLCELKKRHERNTRDKIIKTAKERKRLKNIAYTNVLKACKSEIEVANNNGMLNIIFKIPKSYNTVYDQQECFNFVMTELRTQIDGIQLIDNGDFTVLISWEDIVRQHTN